MGSRVGELLLRVAVVALYIPCFAFYVSWALAATERLQAVATARLVARPGFVLWCLLIIEALLLCGRRVGGYRFR